MGNWFYQPGNTARAGRLLILMAGAILAAGAGHSMAAQSSSLGVGVSVIRSCRINTNDVISSAQAKGDAFRQSQFVRCGRSISPDVSVTPTPIAEQASATTADTLTVTLSF
jgi:hypothetical protein